MLRATKTRVNLGEICLTAADESQDIRWTTDLWLDYPNVVHAPIEHNYSHIYKMFLLDRSNAF